MLKIKKPNKKTILILIIIIFSIVFLYSTGKILFNVIDSKKNKKQYEELAKEVVTIKESEEDEDQTFEVDFDKLLEINENTVGWILFNNNKINNPILQSSNNEYYLSHNIYKKYSVAGSIFLDYRNDNFDDKNTILFAHAMDDDTMFGSLKDLWDDDYFDKEENKYILVQNLDNETLKYEIFSYYITEMEEYYITPEFKSEKDYKKFIETMKKRSKKSFDVEVTTTDKILTLSTCYGYGDTTKRRVVHAKLLVEENIDNESIE